ncbi:MAG: serine hydroxymethyltransferase [Patescibacteria group bacterium]
MKYQNLQKNDLKIFEAISNEQKRQFFGIELIASENYVSENVLEAMGSILTNKYSEGYVNARYYAGNEFIDEIENLAIERAKKIFGVKFANVQPYSGSPANLAVHFALLNSGDKTLGMNLSAGGHLTHGYKVSFSGKYYNSESYGVNSAGFIDMDEVREIAKKHSPKLIWAGFSAYSRILDWKSFREIADEVGAFLVADISHVAGLIAGDVYPSPVNFADVITTTTHKTLRGPRGAMILTNNEEIAKKIDKAVFPGLQGGPHNHITAGIAVALGEVLDSSWKDYAEQVVKNAKIFAEILKKKNYEIVSGGTDNHLFLVDMIKSREISGGEAEKILENFGITLNKNSVPTEIRKPTDPSGVRIGTPAITTRGLKEKDVEKVAEFFDLAIQSRYASQITSTDLKQEIADFMKNFEIPGIKI